MSIKFLQTSQDIKPLYSVPAFRNVGYFDLAINCYIEFSCETLYRITSFVMTKCVHKEDIKFFCMSPDC